MLTLNFTPFPILESERLHFRKLSNDDASEIFELRSNPETMKYIPRPLVTNINEVETLQNKNQFQAKENIEITNKKEFKSSSKDDEWESF